MPYPEKYPNARPVAILYAREFPKGHAGVIPLTAEVQFARLARLADELGAEELARYADRDEGSDGLACAIHSARRGGYLMVYDVDRLGGPLEAGVWLHFAEAKGAKVMLVMDDPAPNRLVQEVLPIYRRVRDSFRDLPDWYERPRWRYKDQLRDRLIQAHHEGKAMRAEGKTWREIGEHFTATGVPHRDGRPRIWTPFNAKDLVVRAPKGAEG